MLEVCLRCVAASPDPKCLTTSVDSSISNLDPHLNRTDVVNRDLAGKVIMLCLIVVRCIKG